MEVYTLEALTTVVVVILVLWLLSLLVNVARAREGEYTSYSNGLVTVLEEGLTHSFDLDVEEVEGD
jgi:hypothetical protein